MKKIGQRIMAVLLCISMILTSLGLKEDVFAAEGSPLHTAAGDTVTRKDWLQSVVDEFGLSIDASLYPDNYFTDVAETDEDYGLVMTATYYGLMNVEAGDPVELSSACTREYAAWTLASLLGFVNENECSFSDKADCLYPDEDQVAVDRGWIALSGQKFLPTAGLTVAEKTRMLADASQLLIDRSINESHENTYAYKAGVKVLASDIAMELTGDNELTISEKEIRLENGTTTTLSVGDIFGIESVGIPLAWKVASITSTEDGYVVKTEGVAQSEAFSSIDVESSVDIDLVEMAESMEHAEVLYIVGGTEENDFKDGTYYETVDEIAEGEVSALAVTEYYSVEEQTMIPVEEGQEYFEEVTQTAESLNASDKYNDTLASVLKVSFTISDCDLKYKSSQNLVEFSALLNLSLTANVDILEGAGIPKSINLIYMPFAYVGYVNVGMNLDLKAMAAVNYKAKVTAGVGFNKSTKQFWFSKSFEPHATGIDSEIEGKIELNATAGINGCIVDGKVYAKAGVQAVYTKRIVNDPNVPNCATFRAWTYATVGASVKETILNQYNYTKEYKIVTEDNSPSRVYLHYEGKADMQLVPECTRGGQTYNGRSLTKYNSGAYSKYISYRGSKGYILSNGEYVEVPIWEYTLDKYYNATITAYHGYAAAVAIPSELDGYPVVALDRNIFYNNIYIHAVSIPDSITFIGDNAFFGCSNLSSVTLSSKLVSTGYGVFQNCTSLRSIHIPKNLKTTSNWNNDKGVFQGSGLSSVTFEEGTTTIAECLFSGCTNLKTITIPDTVTSIGRRAFTMSGLTEITIPDSVTSINGAMGNGGAFEWCGALKKVNMGNGVTHIDEYSFAFCEELEEVTLSKKLESMNQAVFMGCPKITKIEIPKSLKFAAAWNNDAGIFQGTSLSEVTFEEGTTYIPPQLFVNATELTEITIPDTVTKIGGSAFFNTGIKKIVIPESVTELEYAANFGPFAHCAQLKEVEIKNGLAYISPKSFAEDNVLEKIVIPDSVTGIGDNAFYYCIKLSDVTLSKNLASMGYAAFRGCKALKQITIPKSLVDASSWNQDQGIFQESGLSSVTFEEGTTVIAPNLFCNATSLESIEIPKTVTTIGVRAFHGSGLKSITIPGNVKVIGDSGFIANNGTFDACVNLETVILEEGVESIGTTSFTGDVSLKSITIPNSVKDMGHQVFRGCTALEEAKIGSGLLALPENTFLDCTKLKKVEFADSVERIVNSAFKGCKALTDIKLPSTLKVIEKNAFNDCESLVSVELPESVYEIGEGVFAYCDLLEDVSLSTELKWIPRYAFIECTSLESIELPYKIGGVDTQAFEKCTKLTTITIPRKTETFGENIFSYPAKMTVKGVTGTKAEEYAKANNIKFEAIDIPATKIELDKDAVKILRGKNEKIRLIVSPKNFTDEYAFKSLDENIATVDDDGNISAIGVGKTKVKAYVGDNLEAVCEIEVVQPVTSISISSRNITIEGGETKKLTATAYPENAYDKNITWSSDDESIAKVTQDGEITGIKKGTVYIYAAANDGSDVSNYCYVTVASTVNKVEDLSKFESAHSYAGNTDERWTYTLDGAKNLKVTFDEKTITEEGIDFIYIYNSLNNEVGKYSGTELAGKSIVVGGNTFTIRLVTDSKVNKWGFKVTNVEATNDEPDTSGTGTGGTEAGGTGSGTGGTGTGTGGTNPGGTVSGNTVPGNIDEEPLPENGDVLTSDIPANGVIPTGAWSGILRGETVYTGKPITPQVRVYNGKKLLTAGTDYVIKYSNNTNASAKAKYTITFKGAYKKTKKIVKTFTITQASMEDVEAYAGDLAKFKNPGIFKSKPFVDHDGLVLGAANYTIKYYLDDGCETEMKGKAKLDLEDEDFKEVFIKLTGKKNMTGEKVISYRVYRQLTKDSDLIDLSKATIKVTVKTHNETGEEIKPEFTVTYKKNPVDSGFETTYIGNVKKGTAVIMINGDANSCVGAKTINFRIK